MSKPVTVAQVTEVRNIANQCGISRAKFQNLIDSGKLKKFFMSCMDSELLEFVNAVFVAGTDNFVVSDHFKVGETDGVKIGVLGDNFKTNFSAKIEEKVPGADLRIHRLKKGSQDLPIILELGGEEIVETSLAHMWSMLKKQGHGQEGHLLANGNWNIFYIRDDNGVLWAVSAAWSSFRQDWSIEAYSIENPREWFAGYQVISR